MNIDHSKLTVRWERKRQAGWAYKWNMACNTIEVKLDDKRVCDCFVGRSSFAALHSCHEDHPPKPQWHHHLTQLSPATVRALGYLLWKYFCFPFTLKLRLFIISLFSHHFFDRELALAVLYVCFCLLVLLLLSFLNFQSQIGNIFLFLIGIFSFF